MFDDKEFDRRFQRAQWFAFVMMGVLTLVTFVLVGFAGWVVVKLMQHFGVI